MYIYYNLRGETTRDQKEADGWQSGIITLCEQRFSYQSALTSLWVCTTLPSRLTSKGYPLTQVIVTYHYRGTQTIPQFRIRCQDVHSSLQSISECNRMWVDLWVGLFAATRKVMIV